MSTARVIVLIIGLSAGGFAAHLARGSDDRSSHPVEPVAQMPTTEILVAKSDIGLGQSVKPEDLQWQVWPAASASNNLISRAGKADAMKEIAGSIARAPFIAGHAPKEKEGINALIGKTATLELKPEQSETLARARQSGTLSLALRSIVDVNIVDGRSDDPAPKRGDGVNVVRYGVATQTTAQK